MKKDSIGNYKRVIFTLIVMVAIISCSCVISYMISKMEEQACLDTLNESVNEVATEIESRISSDQRLLASIADIIASEEDINSPDVQRIINSFEPNTMISHIALLLPGDKLMLPNEPVILIPNLLIDKVYKESRLKGGKSKP